MAEPLIVLIMEGGMLQAVLADRPVRVRVIDWDALDDTEDPDPDRGEGEADTVFDGRAALEAHVHTLLADGGG